jgi:hypothetical protein
MVEYKRNERHNTFLSAERRLYQKQEGRHQTKSTRARVLASLSSPLFAAIGALRVFVDSLQILLVVSVVSQVMDGERRTLPSIHIRVDAVQLCTQIKLSRVVP